MVEIYMGSIATPFRAWIRRKQNIRRALALL